MRSLVLVLLSLLYWAGPALSQSAPGASSAESRRRATYARYLLGQFDGVVAASRSTTLPRARAALQKQPPELEESLRLIETAAEQDDPAALYLMGYVKENELPFEGQVEIRGDVVAAAEWYQKAAERGLVPAMCRLGELHAYGSLGTYDYEAAARWWEQAANAGSVSAMRELGGLYQVHTPEKGALVAPQHQKAVMWYRRAAEKGDSKAMYQIARYYHFGKGIQRDEAQSTLWLTRAADAGEVKADQVRRGILEFEELDALQGQSRDRQNPASTAQDPDALLAKVSRDELVMAINSGSQEARLRLGEKYERGLGLKADLEQALEQYQQVAGLVGVFRPAWISTAASEGIVRIYASGRLKREPPASDICVSDPNQLPSPELRYQLAELYWRGNDAVKANPTNAITWYLHAARAGSAPAMQRIGELWRSGANGSPDPGEADRWFRRAARLKEPARAQPAAE